MFLLNRHLTVLQGSLKAAFKVKVFCLQEILKQQSLRMFELVQKHPPHWPPFIPPTKPEVTTTGAGMVRAALLCSSVSLLSKEKNSRRWHSCAFLIKQYLSATCPNSPYNCQHGFTYFYHSYKIFSAMRFPKFFLLGK